MTMMKRVERLEAARSPTRRWHRLIQSVGETQDQALDRYGRERIGVDDGVILRVIVAPETRAHRAP